MSVSFTAMSPVPGMVSGIVNVLSKYFFLANILVPRIAIKNYHKLGGLKQQKFILSQFWKPQVWNKSVGGALLPQKGLGKVALRVPCLIVAWLLVVATLCLCLHMAFS